MTHNVTWMSHGTHSNKSQKSHQWVMAHNINESWHTMSHWWAMNWLFKSLFQQNRGIQIQEKGIQIPSHTSDWTLSRFLLHTQIQKLQELPVTLQVLILSNYQKKNLQSHFRSTHVVKKLNCVGRDSQFCCFFTTFRDSCLHTKII